MKFVENGEDSIGATTARIVVPPNKLSFGFANAWADGNKFLRVQPKDIVSAYMRLPIHERPRGVMCSGLLMKRVSRITLRKVCLLLFAWLRGKAPAQAPASFEVRLYSLQSNLYPYNPKENGGAR